MKTRSSKPKEQDLNKSSAQKDENKVTEDVLLESRLNNLTTIVTTLAKKFSEVKKPTDTSSLPNLSREKKSY